MPQEGRRPRQAGLLTRFFCFAPQARARVGVKLESSTVERAKRQREPEAPQAAVPAQASGAPAVARLPGTPSSAAALAAYLGSSLAPAPSSFGSTDTSLQLTSSGGDTSSLGSAGASGGIGGCADSGSGSGRCAPSLQGEGYDADSDCPASEDFTPHRFRTTVRHLLVEAGAHASPTASAVAPEHETEQEGRVSGVCDTGPALGSPAVAGSVNALDAQSPGSSRGKSSGHAGLATPVAAARQEEGGAAQAVASWDAAVPSQSPLGDSQPPSRASSRASRSSFAASGSISLYHFLGAGSRRGGHSLRSLASRHPAASTLATELDAGASLADESGDVAVVSERSPLALPLPRKASSRAAQVAALAAPNTVVRRLSEIQGSHYTSLEKLRQQCGSFEEPPPDLLSLLARRVFASRSSLLQRLRSEGQLSDLQAANDSAQHTPSQGTLASPRSPPPRPQQEREQQQQAEGQRAEGPALPELHHLPRIRTRPARQGYGSSGSSSGR
ncbi:hypothetical protein ABPG77_001754 [Micractinium sp. CCAP 211/92]